MPALRDIVRTEDRGAAVHAIGTLAGRLSTSIASPRFFAIVIAVFAGLALTLAAIGLYGVLSYTVTLRRRELGIRAALGASRGDLLRLVVRQGLAATVAGLALGTALSLGAAWLMRSLLFGVEPTDVPSYVGAAAALLAVALAACLVPARRAAASDPQRRADAGIARAATPTCARIDPHAGRPRRRARRRADRVARVRRLARCASAGRAARRPPRPR